jgi:hypothetical protein
MTAGVLAMGAAAFGLAALSVSLLVGIALPAVSRVAGRLTPSAAAWLWRAMAFAPAACAAMVVAAVFWLVPCHCVAHGAHHPHLCAEHATAWPAASVALLAGVLALRWLVTLAKSAWRAWRSHEVRRSLEAASVVGDDGVRRVPGASPWAVTVGLLRPRVFFTEAMSADADACVVLAHERAHATGRHELWQWCVSLAASLHVPGVGAFIARQLSVAQEMAADEAAALDVVDRERVAAALVRLARQARSAPAAGFAFGASPLSIRVRSLLSEPRPVGSGRLVATGLTFAGLLVAGAIAMNAEGLHHSLETLFGHLR